MPMYSFRCKNSKCDHLEEDAIVPWDTNYIKCPKCKSQMFRLLTTYSFQLKGDGWFKDGYSKKPPTGEKK